MSFRSNRITFAALALAIVASGGTINAQTQVGDAYILFNINTGELRMNPGHAVASGGSYFNPSQVPLSKGIKGFQVGMDSNIGTLSTNVNDYYFPSGTWPNGFPPTIASNSFSSNFQTWMTPNVNGGGDSLNKDNLVIGSPWVMQTGGTAGSTGAEIPGTTAVYASTIPGYEGLPEFSFGTVGPTNLTAAQALAALGATTEGGFATGSDRSYALQNVVGLQFFKIYTAAVPEPNTIAFSLAGAATISLAAWRKRQVGRRA